MTAIEPNSATYTRGTVYTEMLERLSDYHEYENGWDGDNALPLSKQVVKNFKAFLQKSKDSELQGWTIFPQQPMAHCFFRTENGSLVSTLVPMAIRIMRLLTEK